MNPDLILQRARVLCPSRAVHVAKRQHRKHASLERQWVLEKARLVAMEAGA